jgi:hypothetical protein
MSDQDVTQHARALAPQVAQPEARSGEAVPERDAPVNPFALRLAGVGAGATPPPWYGGDRATVASVLDTIQRTAGNRAACLLLERHAGGAVHARGPGVAAQRRRRR